LAALALLVALLVRTAWISDDAFITMRVADNFVHGHGLRWNVDDRVQVYTHPLWLAVLVPFYALTGEVLWTVGMVSIAVMQAAIALAARGITTRAGIHRALVFVLLISCSRTVLSYGTSGLENPLALLLLVWLWLRCDRDEPETHPTTLVLLAALIGLTRLDLLIIAAPVVGLRLRRIPLGALCRAFVVGGAPLWAWELFSVFYYGSFVPNTALAKLGAGASHLQLASQSTYYYLSMVVWDPFATALLVVGLVAGLTSRNRPLAIGVLAYGVYLVWIGGDFMVGRFFSTPVVLCTLMLCVRSWPSGTSFGVAALPLLLVLSPKPGPFKWLTGRGPVWGNDFGVVDERYFYWGNTGLTEEGRARDLNEHYYARFGMRMRGRGVVIESCIGMVGYYAGPTVHIIDPLALADPLLARLPAANPGRFRPGHFERAVPGGYEATLRDPTIPFPELSLRRYWSAIYFVTRGPLFSWERVHMALDLALGRLDHLRDKYVADHPPPAAR
jgi:arabinofuranosyltransferase